MRFPAAAFARDGFCVIEGVLGTQEVKRLRTLVERDLVKSDGRGGVRNLLDLAPMRELAESAEIREIVQSALGPGAQAVRGILFDKTGDANWKVPWHQDLTIAVAEHVETEGYGPWSRKDGVTHVQPPAKVLEQMVSVRIHLDDCPEDNGALRVVRGSHTMGKIQERQIAAVVAEREVAVCESPEGGVLLMRPLLLHASSAATIPGHRRVIHFDYAGCVLTRPLRWAVPSARA